MDSKAPNQKALLIVVFTALVVILLGIFAWTVEKPASQIFLEDSEYTANEFVHIKVLEITDDSVQLQVTNLSSGETHTLFPKFQGDIYNAGNFYLIFRDFFSYLDPEGNQHFAAIATQYTKAPTFDFCLPKPIGKCLFGKRIYTSWIPVKTTSAGPLLQTITPIPSPIGGVAQPPITSEELRSVSMKTQGGFDIDFGVSNYGETYSVLSQNSTTKNIEWIYGTNKSGYISYEDIVGIFVEFTGDITVGNTTYNQNLPVILQTNRPAWCFDIPERRFVFETQVFPESGILKLEEWCLGMECRALK